MRPNDWRSFDGPTHFTKASIPKAESNCYVCRRLTQIEERALAGMGSPPRPYTCTDCWTKAHLVCLDEP